MAGRGPAPDAQRVRRGRPARGDWTPSPDSGWQHEWPEPPPGITTGSVEVWGTWLRSWWAAEWSPDDLPVLRLSIRLYDRVMRGDIKRLPELRQWLDSMGITLKGRQDRRWQPPVRRRRMSERERLAESRPDLHGPYAHLRLTGRSQDTRSVKERFATTQDEQGRWAVREVDDRRAQREADIRDIEQAHRPSARERLAAMDEEDEQRRRLSVLGR